VTDEYDIIIVGGGLVGATLACALAALQYRVALLEAVSFGASHQPSYDDRSLALALGSKRILSAIGLWSALAPIATPIRAIHISEHGRFGTTRLNHDREGVEAFGFVVPARDVGHAAFERLAGQRGLAVIAPARLQRFTVEPSCVTLSVTRDQSNAEERALQCKLMIAADGTDSEVRHALGIDVWRSAYEQTAIIANFTPSRPQPFTAFERFTEIGPVAVVPRGADDYGLIWTHTREGAVSIMNLDDAGFLDALQARFGYRLGRFNKVGTRRSYPLSLSVARELVRPRIALVGNAAHTVHPIAGQGFNVGLRDVAALCESLCRWSPGDPGDYGLLRHYAAIRLADVRRTVRFTDGLARLFSNPFKPLTYMRGATLLALNLIPPLRHGLARSAMGLGSSSPQLSNGVAIKDLR
jgi:2-octaprenyl-6-methoxyphenol hydroxylase